MPFKTTPHSNAIIIRDSFWERNSGSPALDAYGNLVGLNFDWVWEGTISDINYGPSICRNIIADIRYVLFVVDKYADAGHLVKEMKLVHPKTDRKYCLLAGA